jgi:scyllo-inositol 2-dehydrogenase (NADP+)
LPDPIRAGVIGFGVAGRIFHAAVVDAVPGLELACIVQRHGDEAAEAHPGVTIYRDAQQAFDDPSIQLIIIATPNDIHYDLVRRALEAGKHVVVDKPFTIDSADAAHLVELGRKQHLLVSAYQNRRWDGDFLTVKEILESGALGRLVSYESHFDRWRPVRKPQSWREAGTPGGGLLWDLGPHLMDQAIQLFGLPYAIFADVRVEREGGITVDAFDIRLYYPTISSVLLRVTNLSIVPGPRFNLNGDRGNFLKYGLDPQEDLLKAGQRFESPTWGTEPAKNWGILTTEDEGSVVSRPVPTQAGDYRGYYANIRDAILGTQPLAVTPEQATQVIRLLELAQESSDKRTAVLCDLSNLP